jgi:2-haloacid dehalogenase
MAFAGVKACVFDAYGTLFDVHSPVAKVSGRLGPSALEFSKTWRQKQLEYTWLRSLMREHADFKQVTADALDYALKIHRIEDSKLREDLMQLYKRLDAYSDARACLQALAKTGVRTAILSNGTPEMLAEAAASAELSDYLDEIISVEEVGVFKPDPRVYARALDRLGIDTPSAIFFVSANPWDAQGAARFGFQVARVDRFALPDENIPGKPAIVIKSLLEIPNLVK